MTPSADEQASRDGLVGTVEVVGAATLWGLSGIFSVVLFRAGVAPLDVAFFRPLVATALLLAWCLAFDRRAFRLPRGDLVVLWVVGGGVTAVFQIGYQMATEAVGVPATVGLLYLAPALVMLFGGPLLGGTPRGVRSDSARSLCPESGPWLRGRGDQRSSTRTSGPRSSLASFCR